MDIMEKKVAEILLRIKAVTLRTNPPYKWVNGIFAPIYTDNRLILSHPAERRVIVNIMLETIKKKGLEADVIAGVATSGIPWAALVSEVLGKPMIYVRPKKKGHGKENLVEGKLAPGHKVLVIEDLISTGGSSISAVESVREVGGVVESCLAIFTYELEQARANFVESDCELITLSNFTTLVKTASETGYIREEERGKVIEWSEDPEGWGKKMGFE